MTNATQSRVITDYQSSKKKVEDRSWGDIFSGGLAGTVLMLFFGAWYAFVVWKLYGWFAVPLGAPLLNWWHTWGLLMLFGCVVSRLVPERPGGIAATLVRNLAGAVAFAVTLLVGWFASVAM